MYPAIVPAEIYYKVRDKINLNKYGKRSIEVVYLLRNKLKCGYCGMPISAECGTAKNGTKKHYYKCLGRKRNNGCKKSMIRKETLEDFVLDNILSILQNKKYMSSIIETLLKVQAQENLNSLLSSLTKERKQTETTLNNVMRAVEQGIINNTTNKRMKELELQIEELDRQILIQKSKNSFKISKEEIQEFYIQALELEPKLLIDYLIKEIRL